MLVKYGFDVVTVGIEGESAVIARMIVSANARRAVVSPAGREGGSMKCVDLGAAARGQTNMNRRNDPNLLLSLERGLARTKPQLGLAIAAKPSGGTELHDQADAERR